LTHINIHLACKKASESFSPNNPARHPIQSIEIEIEIEIEKKTGYVFPLQACVTGSFVSHYPTAHPFHFSTATKKPLTEMRG